MKPLQASAFGYLPTTFLPAIKTVGSSYAVQPTDSQTVIAYGSTGQITVSLPPAVQIGAGFTFYVWNTGAHVSAATSTVTIDPYGSETIDYASTLVLRAGEGMQIYCDGTNWQSFTKKPMRLYAENASFQAGRPTASSNRSVAIGWGTTSSGIASFCAGQLGSATSDGAVAIGSGVNATGSGSVALGASAYASGARAAAFATNDSTATYGALNSDAFASANNAKASGSAAISMGPTSIASATNSIAFGNTAVASGTNSIALGNLSDTQGITNKTAVGSAATGYQMGNILLRRQTTDATATVLTATAGAASSTNQCILPNNSAYCFSGMIVARQQAAGGTASAAWKVEGLIRREGTASTTTLVNSALTVISNAPGWAIALSADTTNGGLSITATGAAATNIAWFVTLQTAEVTYA